MEHRLEHDLSIQLKICGRFLFYQIGGKAGQQRILSTMLTRGRITQKELQDHLEISSGALSEILQKMEDANLIVRTKSADDKRQVDLALTPGGEETARQVRTHYGATLERMFECLLPEEKEQLGELLNKLVTHLDELKTDPMFMQSMEEACCKPPHEHTARDTEKRNHP